MTNVDLSFEENCLWKMIQRLKVRSFFSDILKQIFVEVCGLVDKSVREEEELL